MAHGTVPKLLWHWVHLHTLRWTVVYHSVEPWVLLGALQLDVRGSTAVLLHACFHLQKDEYVFVFACTGDVEASSSALLNIKRLKPKCTCPLTYAFPGDQLLGAAAQDVILTGCQEHC
jgi:hypothetical protein